MMVYDRVNDEYIDFHREKANGTCMDGCVKANAGTLKTRPLVDQVAIRWLVLRAETSNGSLWRIGLRAKLQTTCRAGVVSDDRQARSRFQRLEDAPATFASRLTVT